jgi:hypothetical protein
MAAVMRKGFATALFLLSRRAFLQPMYRRIARGLYKSWVESG